MSDESKDTQQAIFLQQYRITEAQFAATGLAWQALMEISQCHSAMNAELQDVGAFVSDRLRSVTEVHSLRMRIKDCDHLIEKIIRKKLETGDLSFDATSYNNLVTDLVGVRAIHLFKDQWLPIHQFVNANWELHEEPIAYIRSGDPLKLQKGFREAGLVVREHPFGYRSVHYVIKANPTKVTRLVELQVRTIFEEGWSEIDHQVRYPRQSDDPNLEGFLQIFNRLAGSADEMGAFTKTLDTAIRDNARMAREKEAEISRVINELAITNEAKTRLERKMAELQSLSQPLGISAYDISPQVNVKIAPFVIQGDFGSFGISLRRCSVCGAQSAATLGTCAHCGTPFST